jgi:hypothetical protein
VCDLWLAVVVCIEGADFICVCVCVIIIESEVVVSGNEDRIGPCSRPSWLAVCAPKHKRQMKSSIATLDLDR